MKGLTRSFVALARSAHHEAMLYHFMGDHDMEAHAGELVRQYMDCARRSYMNEPLPFPLRRM